MPDDKGDGGLDGRGKEAGKGPAGGCLSDEDLKTAIRERAGEGFKDLAYEMLASLPARR